MFISVFDLHNLHVLSCGIHWADIFLPINALFVFPAFTAPNPTWFLEPSFHLSGTMTLLTFVWHESQTMIFRPRCLFVRRNWSLELVWFCKQGSKWEWMKQVKNNKAGQWRKKVSQSPAVPIFDRYFPFLLLQQQFSMSPMCSPNSLTKILIPLLVRSIDW